MRSVNIGLCAIPYKIGKRAVPHRGTKLFAFESLWRAERFISTAQLMMPDEDFVVVEGVGAKSKAQYSPGGLLNLSVHMARSCWEEAMRIAKGGYRRNPIPGTVFCDAFTPKRVVLSTKEEES